MEARVSGEWRLPGRYSTRKRGLEGEWAGNWGLISSQLETGVAAISRNNRAGRGRDRRSVCHGIFFCN
ncbi:hypothetical protein [Bradyrhizobium sp.]|uniref:hypothetical protein n=1 Tax=Bradyrhizobium sp. TaxID=376 RepID=UPI0025BADFD0|nr:hypothetical protein [Bradyrhizobium sp.]